MLLGNDMSTAKHFHQSFEKFGAKGYTLEKIQNQTQFLKNGITVTEPRQ
jgi:hypothetical protein